MTSEQLIQIIQYIADDSRKLKDKYLKPDEATNIEYLTIFPKSDGEFKKLNITARKIAKKLDENNGTVYELDKPVLTFSGKLKIFRIRKYYPDRNERGCADYKASDYQSIRGTYIKQYPSIFSVIDRPLFEMTEIKDSSFDTRVYFVQDKK